MPPTDIRQYPRTGFDEFVITGASLSTNQKTKGSDSSVPTIPTAAGTTEVTVIAGFTGTLSGARFVAKDALAAHDTNFLTFAIVNKGQAGAGATAMLAATNANTTKITGGTALAAYTTRNLTLHGTAANLAVVAGDCLAIQVIGAGTLANTVTEGHAQLQFQVVS